MTRNPGACRSDQALVPRDVSVEGHGEPVGNSGVATSLKGPHRVATPWHAQRVKLIGFTISGYRRFLHASSLKLHGDMIAIVGPNEAGKSSLLRAMAQLNERQAFSADEPTRRHKVETKLVWQFELSSDDRTALVDIPEASGVRSVRISKEGDGTKRNWTFLPSKPVRDLSPRQAAALAFETVRASLVNASERDERLAPDALQEASEALASESESLASGELDRVAEIATAFGDLAILLKTDAEDPAGEIAPNFGVEVGTLESVSSNLLEFVVLERAPVPSRRCISALDPRIPEIVFFARSDRELASEYDLTQVAENPPSALDHLCHLAGLDLVALRDEVAAGTIADVSTRRDAANRELRRAFAEAWHQVDVAVQIEVQGTLLHVQATTPGDLGVSTISERSDGMRWFAALLAYAHGWSRKPILLVDEIETHLHYDAQADLIQVLAQQDFTSKVIYTTHSFGSLPPDLGQGVRVVEQVDASASRLRNGFWDRGAGFSPLLSAMGAAATSLTPTRHAIIGEGPSEAILLPSVLRQGTTKPVLFQVAPGLASVAAAAVPDLESEAGRVAFLVDGDPAGAAIEKSLRGSGVSETRITRLTDQGSGEPLVLEDLVDEQVIANAWNDEIQLWQEGAPAIPATEFASPCCITRAEAWAHANGVTVPDKVAVAQRVLDQAHDADGADVPIFRESRRTTIEWLSDRLATSVGL